VDKQCRAVGASGARTCAVALAAAVAAIGVAVAYLIPGRAALGLDIAWTSSAVAALGGMLLARRAAVGHHRRRFTLWAVAAGFWLIGQLLWDLYGIIGFPASPNLADVAWWAFAVVVTASLIRSDARSRAVRVVVLAETLPAMGAAIALTMAELWHEAAVSTLPPASATAALVYPSIYVAAAVVMLQAIIGGALRGYRRSVVWLIMGGLVTDALGFCLWAPQLLARTYVPGATPLDPLWVLGLIMIAVGGVLSARRVENANESNEPDRRGGVLPALMFLLLLAALFQTHVEHAPAGVGATLAAGLLLCGAALIGRGMLLERRLRELLDRERAARASLADREAELARLNAQLVEDSRRDPLTGMRNRRALADDLHELEARRRDGTGTFAVALCDVDHFKAYNDRLGHLAGDQALRTIAATVRGALRTGDLAYRFGGEELLLVLRDASPAEALAAAERVRAAVEKMALPHSDGVGRVMTVSIGVAAGDADADALLARADAALYQAKDAGRNRVAAAEETAVGSVGRHREPAADDSVPRHLRSMLAVSRAAAAGGGPGPVLEALAETIRSELSFHIVAVNLMDPVCQELECVIVLGDDDAREMLLGTRQPSSEWEPALATEYDRHGAIWLPAGTSAWQDEILAWTPPTAAAPGPDAWHPEDMLLLPLRGQDGALLGVVSVDQPVTGRRPSDEQLAYLMSVVDHAALAVEQSRRAAGHSAEQSAELRLAAAMLLAETLDLRDPGTARHSRTVGELAGRTAVRLDLAPDRVRRVHAAGVLHDLGKLGIADAILYKPGPLTGAEWEEMRRHPEIGARILVHAGLGDIASWVRAHHERIDGAGYPDRLDADEIPLEARILAVADAYEAMIADRPYRSGMSAQAARAELERCSATQFDSEVVQAFLAALADGAPAGEGLITSLIAA
jgi:diguanylate cyclase (GGDEF)-like protein